MVEGLLPYRTPHRNRDVEAQLENSEEKALFEEERLDLESNCGAFILGSGEKREASLGLSGIPFPKRVL